MARRKRYDVFVSYSHKDAAIVKRFVQVLSLSKRRVFWDEIIQPGQEWNKEIESALVASDAIVIMWCCDSAASDWVTREIETALRLGKPIAPFQLCAYPLPATVSSFQTINLSSDLHHDCDCVSKEVVLRPTVPKTELPLQTPREPPVENRVVSNGSNHRGHLRTLPGEDVFLFAKYIDNSKVNPVFDQLWDRHKERQGSPKPRSPVSHKLVGLKSGRVAKTISLIRDALLQSAAGES